MNKLKQTFQGKNAENLSAILFYPALVLVAYYVSGLIISTVAVLIFGIDTSGNIAIDSNVIDSALFGAIITATNAILMLVIILAVPFLFKKVKTTLKELGLVGLPTWTDILVAPLTYAVVLIVASLVLQLVSAFLSVDVDQAQTLPFSPDNMIATSDYILAFFSIVIIAPISEEIIFRGFLYARLRPHVNMWISATIVSLLFGFVHGQLNVGIVTFIMSFATCLIREKVTGTIWAGIIAHMIQNGVAFWFLFNPLMLN